MPVTRIITDLAEARRTVLKRTPLGSEEIPAPVAARIQEVFGAALTPGEVVDRILEDVQAEGDAALARYIAHFDGVVPEPLEVSDAEIKAAVHEVDDTLLDVLRLADSRIAAYHERQRRNSWMDFESGLGEMVRPLQRVGIYSPGTERVYPSSVLMSVGAGTCGGRGRDQSLRRRAALTAACIRSNWPPRPWQACIGFSRSAARRPSALSPLALRKCQGWIRSSARAISL